MKKSIMLPSEVYDDLKQIVVKLVDLCNDNLLKVILFGSFATNKYQLDSDYDICIVLRQLPLANSDKQLLRDIGEHCGIKRSVDVVMCSPLELEEGQMVFKYIRKEGILLYG